MLFTEENKLLNTTTQQFLRILIILNIITEEVIATSVLVTTGIAMAVLIHFSILIFFAYQVALKVLANAMDIIEDSLFILQLIFCSATEVFFNYMGTFIAMVIAAMRYVVLFFVLCGRAVYTLVMVLKQTQQRKMYFRRLIKLVTFVAFVFCLSQVMRESKTVVMDMTKEYGKTTFTLVLGYLISGRSAAST